MKIIPLPGCFHKQFYFANTPFLNAANKPWSDLTIKDADDYFTAKRLDGIMPETYNHYYGVLKGIILFISK